MASPVSRGLSLSGLLVVVGCYGQPRVQFPTAESAIERLREQTNCSRAVQGEAELAFSGEGRRLNGQILYLAQAPDKVRFDVYSSFGVTLSTLTSDGDRFALYNLEDKSFFYGPARTCNVQRFTRVPVPAFALVELLRGRPPVLAHTRQGSSIDFSGGFLSRGHYQLTFAGTPDATQTVEIAVHPDDWHKPLSDQRLRLKRVEVAQAGSVLYEVELGGYGPARRANLEPTAEDRAMGITEYAPTGPVCDAELPRKVTFYVPETGYQLTFRNEEIVHNPPISSASFQQNFPGGVVAQESFCND